jgi:hypothetical protein
MAVLARLGLVFSSSAQLAELARTARWWKHQYCCPAQDCHDHFNIAPNRAV